MSISGIGAYGYPAPGFYQTRRSAKSTDGMTSTGQTDETVQRSQMSSSTFELHISNDEDGEVVSAMCGRDHSITVYKPKDFDPANPVYKAKVWDKDGNAITELDQLYGPDKDTQTSIDTEWLDQVDYLENYIKEHGVDSITVDENGKPTNDDLKDYVSLDVRPMLEAVKGAIGNEADD